MPFLGCSNFTDTLRLIEGICSMQNLLGNYYFTEVYLYPTQRLYCHQNNTQILHFDGRFGHCQLLTDVHEVVVDYLFNQISPNPTKGVVNIP
ncbi:hypothetical protein N9B55_00065 [Vicingaceae bacterium]|nr:hypothetical protein [Vicingaceae bacterium]